MDDIVILNWSTFRVHWEVTKIVVKLQAKYKIWDLDDLQWFLNIWITRDRTHHHIYLTQNAYINKISK